VADFCENGNEPSGSMLKISLAEQLLAFQEGICSMGLVSFLKSDGTKII
jgi:hypothetical protein